VTANTAELDNNLRISHRFERRVGLVASHCRILTHLTALGPGRAKTAGGEVRAAKMSVVPLAGIRRISAAVVARRLARERCPRLEQWNCVRSDILAARATS
jgi:hypothetical protein